MKLNVNIVEKAKATYEFPFLAKSKASGIIVLFLNKNSGIILHNEESITGHKFGYSIKPWDDSFDQTFWEIIPMTVTLTQS